MKDKNSFFIRGFTQSAIFTFMSRISGFIRDIFIAAFLGAGIFQKSPFGGKRKTDDYALWREGQVKRQKEEGILKSN